MCSRLDEDGGHLLFKCKESKGAWRELNLKAIRCQLAAAVTALEVMEIIVKLQGKEQIVVIFLLWLWWGERNRRREEERSRTPVEIAYMADADRFQNSTEEVLLVDHQQCRRWMKPGAGELKLNSDGAFDINRKGGGWGFVIRNDQGLVIQAGAGGEDFL